MPKGLTKKSGSQNQEAVPRRACADCRFLDAADHDRIFV